MKIHGMAVYMNDSDNPDAEQNHQTQSVRTPWTEKRKKERQ